MENKVFMAVKAGKASEEGVFKLYKGVAAFKVLAVNPNKAELKGITGRDLDEEPEYKTKTEEGKDQLRLTFYIQTVPEAKVNSGIKLTLPLSFTLVKDYRKSQSDKVQIIDKYGRTAWVTKDEYKDHKIPVYSNGPANISADYRAAFQGEELLVNFLIKWLNIPNVMDYKDGKWVMKSNPEDSEVSLDMDALFKGDLSEIKSLIDLAKEYMFKAAVGVRTNDEGKQYQAVFNREFAKNAVTDYSKLDAAIIDFQNNGGAATTEYSVEPLHENVVQATTFTPATAEPSAPESLAAPWEV